MTPFVAKRNCTICNKEMTDLLYYADEAYDETDPLLKLQDSEMCDTANSEGCFKLYHTKDCFDQHVCPAHPVKK